MTLRLLFTSLAVLHPGGAAMARAARRWGKAPAAETIAIVAGGTLVYPGDKPARAFDGITREDKVHFVHLEYLPALQSRVGGLSKSCGACREKASCECGASSRARALCARSEDENDASKIRRKSDR